MNGLKKNKAPAEWIYLISAVITSLFFIFFNDSSFNRTLSSAGLDAFSLLNYDYFSFRAKKELKNEIIQIKEQVVREKNENMKLKYAYEENIRLRELLNIDVADSLDYIYGKVVGHAPGSFGRILLLNSGTEKGVEENDPVITVEGLIGAVCSISRNMSKVRLISDPSFRISVRTERKRIPGILRYADGSAGIEEITKTSDVKKGEKVYTSDFSTVFPPGLEIGKVISVSDSSATINKIIEIEFSSDLHLAEDVFIIKKK